MKTTDKKTPSNIERGKDPKSSGKKLKQARLPFKILPSSPCEGTTAESSSVSTPVASTSPRKRKLSYSEESSDIKENFKSATGKEVVDTIVLDDSDSELTDEPKTPKAKSACKLKIKLPTSGKKKRKSFGNGKSKPNSPIDKPSKKAKLEVDDSDIEFVSEDLKLNENKDDDDDNEVKVENTEPFNEEILEKSPKSEEEVKVTSPQMKKSEKEDESNTEEEIQTSQNTETPKLLSASSKTKQSESTGSRRSIRMKNNQQSAKESNIKTTEKNKEVEEKNTDQSENESEDTKKNEESDESKIEETVEKNECSQELKSANNDVKAPVKNRRSIKAKENPGTPKTPKMKSSTTTPPTKNAEKSSTEDDVEIVEDEIPQETKLNNSVTKATPRNRRSVNTTDNTGTPKATTPGSLKKSELRRQQQKEERERKEALRIKEKEEKELQRKRERDDKEAARLKEKEEKESLKIKEKEEKEAQRLKEKEKKIAEQEAKNEEKRKKEDDERKKKEEIENKKKKAAEAFTKFFVKPKTHSKDLVCPEETQNIDDSCLAFRPFQKKADMHLAPTVRRIMEANEKSDFDSIMNSDSNNHRTLNDLYIRLLRKGQHSPHREIKQRKDPDDDDDDDDDIILLDEEDEFRGAGEKIVEVKKSIQRYRVKFLQFRENRRPPYYGTWRKKSKIINARKPLSVDKVFFDYEVDSDDEWEEEEPGESLHGSEDEKESADEEDYDIDNKFMVPHGHLSDEELGEDEEQENTSREAQKVKLEVMQQEFAKLMKKKTEKIKPRLVGIIWQDENGNKPDSCPDIIWESLSKRAMIFKETIVLEEEQPVEEDISEDSNPNPSPVPQRMELTDDLIKELIHLVQGNSNSKHFLTSEFIAYVAKKYHIVDENLGLKKSKTREKIEELAGWGSVEVVGANDKKKKRLCWVVSPEHLEKYSLSDLSTDNKWTYTLERKKTIPDKKAGPSENQEKCDTTSSKHQNQSQSNNTAANKKRVNILMSVPRGQQIPQQSKNTLISNFLQKSKDSPSPVKSSTIEHSSQESDVIIIDN